MAEGAARDIGRMAFETESRKRAQRRLRLNRCGQLSPLQRGCEERPSFDELGRRLLFERQKAAYRQRGDEFRRIIQLNYGPWCVPDWLFKHA